VQEQKEIEREKWYNTPSNDRNEQKQAGIIVRLRVYLFL
jgi:hypothetical protein